MDKGFLKASDIAEELDISISYAYRIVRMLNEELSNMGYITITGRVNRQYFNERLYYIRKELEN